MRLWQAHFEENGFSIDRMEFQLAQLTALYFNVNRDKGVPAAGVKDFMPNVKIEEVSRETLMTKVKALKIMLTKGNKK